MIIREFEKLPYDSYEKKRPEYEPTDSYFYLARNIEKWTMRADDLNWHGYGGYTEMTDPSSNVCFTDKDESKRIIVQKHYRRETT